GLIVPVKERLRRQILVLVAITVSVSACSSPFGRHGYGDDSWKAQSQWRGRDSIELSEFDRLIPAKGVKDRDFKSWVKQGGVGEPAILWRGRRPDDTFVSDTGTAIPVTRVSGKGDPVIYDVLDQDTAIIAGERQPLAANFTAPLAYLSDQGDVKLPVIDAMIHNDKYAEKTGLYRFEPVDPERIPVLLIHGLKSSPTIWKTMVNQMRADPQVRENFQFWSFSYPTGLPVLFSAMRLREEIVRMQETYNPGGEHPRMNQMVIIGHSMGGLLTELQIKDSGQAFWPADGPAISSLGLPADQERQLEQALFFDAIPQIHRAVFIATPHRGSDIAQSQIGTLINRLIQLPADITGTLVSIATLDPILGSADEKGRRQLANSIDNLKPDSPFLRALRGIPFPPDLPIHSIVAIGEKPADPFTDADDGLVSYHSAHLDEAVSEKLVASGHRAPNHPDAVREVVRILHLHLQQSR
ncbi:MAG: esterase/lipase family protein, partial [Verrucomicrobiales bacterium]